MDLLKSLWSNKRVRKLIEGIAFAIAEVLISAELAGVLQEYISDQAVYALVIFIFIQMASIIKDFFNSES